MDIHDKGSSSATMYHPETDDAYEIDCNWEYSYSPASYYEPGHREFNTSKHSLVSINGEPTNEEIPSWIDWENYDFEIFEKEIG